MNKRDDNLRCLSKRKDTNFKANHNRQLSVCTSMADVCLSAKIRILKQITTGTAFAVPKIKMFV